MPVNEFEKQVQQKMDELRMVPSEPVWVNIESQIRKKKERRRLIIWFFMLFLFISGGLWWFLGNNNRKLHVAENNVIGNQKNEKPVSKQNKEITTVPVTKRPENLSPKNQRHGTLIIGKAINKGPDKLKNKETQIKNKEVLARVIQKPKKDLAEKHPAADQENKMIPDKVIEKKADISTIATNETANVLSVIESSKTDSINSGEKKSIEKETTGINQEADKEKLSTENKTRQHENKKWEKAITAQIGWSNYNYGLFNGEKSFDRLSSVQNSGSVLFLSPGPGFYMPQEITKGASFAVGVELKRLLGNRIRVSTGLQYHYYSTYTKRGAAVEKDSTISYGADAIDISKYYKNGNQSSYTNRFHIIEIPVAFEYRLFRDIPLSISAGASYGHLFKTNALTFNRVSNIYYYNRRDYVSNYLNIFSSIQYTWLKKGKIKMQSGPVFLYNCLELQKENYFGIPHLFSLGLKNSISF